MRVIWSLVIAASIWLPNIHNIFEVDLAQYRQHNAIAPKAQQIAEYHLNIWRSTKLRTQELAMMQRRNPEWNFMSRMYFILALTNMALHDPSFKSEAISIIDFIIEDTLSLEISKGHTHFLLAYAQRGTWAIPPNRSHFIDGELAVMLGARRFLKEDQRYKRLLQERVELMVKRMKQSPILNAESYPRECWLFCNTVSLAAMKMMDHLDGSDHTPLFQEWLKHAQNDLFHHESQLLISTYDTNGTPLAAGQCPEGSTIFMSAHMLQIIDPHFAQSQYQKAKEGMIQSFLGFGYAKEWITSCVGHEDIDSGPIIPFLSASASSSGLAVLGAATFNDNKNLKSLLTSLEMIGFPELTDGRIRYLASNPVGDAVLLYSLVEGPLWRLIQGKKQ